MKNSRLLTFTCYAAFLAFGVAATLLGPAFQSLAERFKMPLQDAGIFTLLSFGGSTLAIPIVGRLLDRINVRYILAGGPLLMGIGLFVLGNAPTLPIALLGILLVGLGSSVLVVAPNVVMAALNPDNAARSLNFLNVFFGLGAIVGPQIVNLALRQKHIALAFDSAAVFVLLLVIPFALTSLHIHGEKGSRPAPIRWIALIPFAILSFIYVGTETGVGSWIFTQLTKVTLSTEATATIGTSIFWAGLTSGRLAASLIPRRMTDDQLLLIAIVILTSGLVVLLSVPAIEMLAILSAFVIGFGCGPIAPTLMAIVANATPEARGTAIGAISVLGGIGGATLPWLQGQIGAGKSGGMILPLVSGIIMFSLVTLIRRQNRLYVASPES